MTYLQFHLVFTLPIIVALKMTAPRVVSRDLVKAGVSLLGITLIAFAYTTPWDNYLVKNAVWGYGEGRVLGTWGHVPIEEYAFFIIQPILTGLWLYRLLWKRPARPAPPPSQGVRIFGTLVFLGLSVAGAFLLGHASSFYLALILVWACPVLAIQWAYGGHHVWRLRKVWFLATLVPTLYLWIADRIAIEWGIWYISEQYTLGFHLFGLPIEEALFFVVTNLLVVQGLMLLLHTWKVQAVRPPVRQRAPRA